MVYFIGAGPGDPELITLKGIKIIQACDVVIYAGSLVNKEILKYAKPKAEVYDSATMNLDEIIGLIVKSHKDGKDVARIHTGDPAIYGAIHEQIVRLKKENIDYEIIPGVSSFLAAASVLKKELTIPEITQTVIITRIGGRTVVPKEQELKDLSRHGATMAIFLSVQEIDRVVSELKKGYQENTPVAVVYKATWEDQVIVRGTLSDISQKVKSKGINKTAMILVGDFLKNIKAYSKLYDKEFSHSFRKKEDL
ncbi:precorrin-4 C(11)-methyltransferase [Thermoanaerobacterium thermosaccharolyticum]|uniref:Precorrin-4 C(11)-methyltransferase n=1 Tax=Thermoanaerobacterium thermosaccharolyticum TaxID=1517 RepID=A0A231VMI9_THETR|nr:precorrin-4 C(11)-methyltransferase [Thermoanaerobacterium thermosaccharolyticum]OXT08916.1 precorrin-4 C(11)-methyltransferase [Thermoanaerobacterium thermosaccharolyticum]